MSDTIRRHVEDIAVTAAVSLTVLNFAAVGRLLVVALLLTGCASAKPTPPAACRGDTFDLAAEVAP